MKQSDVTLKELKAALRSDVRKARGDLSPADYVRMSHDLSMRLSQHPAVRKAGSVFAYIAFDKEPDTRGLLQTLADQGKTVIAPSANRGTDILRCFHLIGRNDPLLKCDKRGRDIRPDVCDLIEINRIDLFLVPGIAWDRHGYRVGFGGGYFDRLLTQANPRAVILGIAFELQMFDSIPHGPWDVPVDEIVTEKRIVIAKG